MVDKISDHIPVTCCQLIMSHIETEKCDTKKKHKTKFPEATAMNYPEITPWAQYLQSAEIIRALELERQAQAGKILIKEIMEKHAERVRPQKKSKEKNALVEDGKLIWHQHNNGRPITNLYRKRRKRCTSCGTAITTDVGCLVCKSIAS